jgi:hypothetical protein
MSLIKMFFVGSLRALTSDISRRLVDKVSYLTPPTRYIKTDKICNMQMTCTGHIRHSTTPSPLYSIYLRLAPSPTFTRGTRAQGEAAPK